MAIKILLKKKDILFNLALPKYTLSQNLFSWNPRT